MEQSLHEKFYQLREDTWKALDELVRTGCNYIGEFPILLGKMTVCGKSGQRKSIGDTDSIIIYGIVANPTYKMHEDKEDERDLIVSTSEIEVIVDGSTKETRMVEPYLLDLQELCTYLSGGFAAYGDKLTK